MPELRATPADGGPAITALDDGHGPTLLVVHPGGNDATSWNSVTRLLAPDFRVVRIRRRIYIPGATIAATHSMATETADILAIANLLAPPILLVGHSSRAIAALEPALRAPSPFPAMLLYEPPLPPRPPRPRRRRPRRGRQDPPPRRRPDARPHHRQPLRRLRRARRPRRQRPRPARRHRRHRRPRRRHHPLPHPRSPRHPRRRRPQP